MTWFKVSDDFHGHGKVIGVPSSAVGLWVRCGSYAGWQNTDGHIPGEIAARFGRRRDIDALVDSGLWLPAPGGFTMHDFLDYNLSKAQVQRERDANRKRQAQRRLGQPSLFDPAGDVTP